MWSNMPRGPGDPAGLRTLRQNRRTARSGRASRTDGGGKNGYNNAVQSDLFDHVNFKYGLICDNHKIAVRFFLFPRPHHPGLPSGRTLCTPRRKEQPPFARPAWAPGTRVVNVPDPRQDSRRAFPSRPDSVGVVFRKKTGAGRKIVTFGLAEFVYVTEDNRPARCMVVMEGKCWSALAG